MPVFNRLNQNGMATQNNVSISKNAKGQYCCPNDSTPLVKNGFTDWDYKCPKCNLFVRGPLQITSI